MCFLGECGGECAGLEGSGDVECGDRRGVFWDVRV
jgi:hypothetical protein